MNPHNYNFWIYRRQIIRNLRTNDPQKEICFTETQIRENPKNNYAWEHRRAVANIYLSYCTADNEFNLTADLLEIDPKNYFAWQHRQWAIAAFKFTNLGLMTNELRFTEQHLSNDVRNNSAWNQRFYVVKQRGRIDFAFVKNEFKFGFDAIKRLIDNESAWSYMRALLQNFGTRKLCQFQPLAIFVDDQYYNKQTSNRHVVAFLIDSKREMILDFCELGHSSELVETQRYLNLCNLMAEKFDRIRAHYWRFAYKQLYFDKIRARRCDAADDDVEGGTVRDDSWKHNFGKAAAEGEETSFIGFVAEGKPIKKLPTSKKENNEKATGIGTDLLFDLMAKFNNK